MFQKTIASSSRVLFSGNCATAEDHQQLQRIPHIFVNVQIWIKLDVEPAIYLAFSQNQVWSNLPHKLYLFSNSHLILDKLWCSLLLHCCFYGSYLLV
jgi:hypothetical protein